jgi:tetratricopeptide (TPR) repeat protein
MLIDEPELHREAAPKMSAAFFRISRSIRSRSFSRRKPAFSAARSAGGATGTCVIGRRAGLVSRDPGASRPNVAATLDNLGALYVSTGRLGEAEKADTEALAIRRDLAAHDPGASRPSLAISLNSLGIVYKRTGRTNDAEKAYNEALAIYRDLAARDPGAYRPNVAITLHNLGLLYIDMHRQADARELLGEALNIYRDLASTNLAVYAARIESVTKLLVEPRASSSSSGEGH